MVGHLKKSSGGKNSLLQNALPGKDMMSKTVTRCHFLFSLVSYRSAVLLNPQVQVHTSERLDYSVTHGKISTFIPTSDTHFLV